METYYTTTDGIYVYSIIDVIEEIIGEEIVDETDRYESNMGKRVADRKSNAVIMKG